jgi:ATP citrate (pro-S)-lyase
MQIKEIELPLPFGRDLDSKSGASLKLTILNPKGRICKIVAGGGASFIYR